MDDAHARIRGEFATRLGDIAKGSGMLFSLLPTNAEGSLEKSDSSERLAEYAGKYEEFTVMAYRNGTFLGSAYFDFTGNDAIMSGISPSVRDFFMPLINLAEEKHDEFFDPLEAAR